MSRTMPNRQGFSWLLFKFRLKFSQLLVILLLSSLKGSLGCLKGQEQPQPRAHLPALIQHHLFIAWKSVKRWGSDLSDGGLWAFHSLWSSWSIKIKSIWLEIEPEWVLQHSNHMRNKWIASRSPVGSWKKKWFLRSKAALLKRGTRTLFIPLQPVIKNPLSFITFLFTNNKGLRWRIPSWKSEWVRIYPSLNKFLRTKYL